MEEQSYYKGTCKIKQLTLILRSPDWMIVPIWNHICDFMASIFAVLKYIEKECMDKFRSKVKSLYTMCHDT